jgi:hypothetical protein
MISARKGNQRHALTNTTVGSASDGSPRKSTGSPASPASVSTKLTTPKEALSIQRQRIAITIVGTIHESTIHVRAKRRPRKVWCRTSAAANAMTVCSIAPPSAHARLRRNALATPGSPRTVE